MAPGDASTACAHMAAALSLVLRTPSAASQLASALAPVDPLDRERGYDLGLRTLLRHGAHISGEQITQAVSGLAAAAGEVARAGEDLGASKDWAPGALNSILHFSGGRGDEEDDRFGGQTDRLPYALWRRWWTRWWGRGTQTRWWC